MLKPSFFHYHHPHIFPKNLGSYEEKSYLCQRIAILRPRPYKTLKEFRTDLVLTDLQTRQRVSDRIRIVYLQLPLFDKHTEAECMDIFDCWIYIMKNMNMFEQMPFSEKYPVFRKLAEIGDLRKLSREELELYDEDIKNMRDIYATRKFDEKRGMEKGMAKGMEIGMAKGMEKEKLATAHRLLSMGLSDEQVSTVTELPLKEIQKMRKNRINTTSS